MPSRSYEPGAPVAAGEIPLCVPHLGGNELAYLEQCIKTNFVSSVGPFVTQFETMMAERVGVPHAVAATSGTAALHVALLVAGVERDDEVLVSTLTFIAPVNAIRYAGAWPVFVDAEPDHWQMDVARLACFLSESCERRGGVLVNRGTDRRVRAVLPVDILGHPVDMDPLLDLAKRYGLAVVEDATESLGATYRGRPAGSLGHVACLSFNGNKLITTGGGGMLVTADAVMAKRARYLTTQAKDDPIEFVHGAVGFNYRLTNVQAALGVAQMERLDEHIAAKRRSAAGYAAMAAAVPGLTMMRQAPWAESVHWLSTVLVDAARFGMDSRALMGRLSAAGIQARPLWQPCHRSPAHQGAAPAECPVAERLNRDALCLPSSVGLSATDQARVCDAIADARTP